VINTLLWVGRIAGATGVLLCLIAMFARARGIYSVAGLQMGTLLIAAIAVVLVGCLGYFAEIAERGGE
jgi:hypothetical protein